MTFVRRRWTPLHTLLALAGLVLGFAILPIGFKSCAKDTLVETQAPLWTALRDLDEFQDTAALKLKSKDDLIATLRELAGAQAGLELKLKTLDAAQTQRARLEDLLKMPPAASYETRAVRILRRDLNAWWQLVWIDAGSAQGIRAGLGVICREGVVGRVREVYEQTSVVELLTSPRFRMAVQLKGDPRPFIFEGTSLRFGLPPVGAVSALQPEMSLKKGQTREIVTTGLSGSFPSGLPVGTLFDTGTLSEGGLLEGKARLPLNLHSLQEVSLLIPYR